MQNRGMCGRHTTVSPVLVRKQKPCFRLVSGSSIHCADSHFPLHIPSPFLVSRSERPLSMQPLDRFPRLDVLWCVPGELLLLELHTIIAWSHPNLYVR